MATASRYKMISIPEAQAAVLQHTPVLAAEEVPLLGAVGRVLARAVTARDSLPPFPASIKVRARRTVHARVITHVQPRACARAWPAQSPLTVHWQPRPKARTTAVPCLTRHHAPPPKPTHTTPTNPTPPQDGYAVVAADGAGEFPVAFESRPGALPDAPLQPGSVAYITTGVREAALAAGAPTYLYGRAAGRSFQAPTASPRLPPPAAPVFCTPKTPLLSTRDPPRLCASHLNQQAPPCPLVLMR